MKTPEQKKMEEKRLIGRKLHQFRSELNISPEEMGQRIIKSITNEGDPMDKSK